MHNAEEDMLSQPLFFVTDVEYFQRLVAKQREEWRVAKQREEWRCGRGQHLLWILHFVTYTLFDVLLITHSCKGNYYNTHWRGHPVFFFEHIRRDLYIIVIRDIAWHDITRHGTTHDENHFVILNMHCKHAETFMCGQCAVSRIAYNVFNMDRKLGFIAKLPLIIGGFFELG